jgi:hypothetical protein
VKPTIVLLSGLLMDPAFMSAPSYWVSGVAFKDMPGDEPTRQAIAGAAFDAVQKTPRADSLVITRVITHGNGTGGVCAEVYGRAIRLTKAASARGDTRNDATTSEKPRAP